MTAVSGLILAITCIAIVAIAVGLAVACWDNHTPTWTPRIVRGAIVTIGVACILLAASHPIAQALP